MLMHSFVLDALSTTAADTFSHFEMLIDEHRKHTQSESKKNTPSRLQQLVPTVGTFHTRLPLREAFETYNDKYALTKRRHICISFNEIRHILNLAQIIAIRDECKNSNTGEGHANLQLVSSNDEGTDNLESQTSAEFINGLRFDGKNR